MQRAIIDALAEHVLPLRDRASTLQIQPELFREQLAVYESYFQDDPPFDHAQADRFLKSLPCPAMDYAALKHLATAALRNNFGWPKPPPPAKPSRQLLLNNANNGHVVRTGVILRDVDFELQILGGVTQLAVPARIVRFSRSAAAWHANSVLSSNTTARAWKLVVTEQSLMAVLSSHKQPDELLAEGRWSACGALPRIGWI